MFWLSEAPLCALELAVWELLLGFLQGVLLLLILPEVDHLCGLVQQQHLVPAWYNRYKQLTRTAYICSYRPGPLRIEQTEEKQRVLLITVLTPMGDSPKLTSAPPRHLYGARRSTL